MSIRTRIALGAIYLLGLASIVLFSGNDYGWMSDVEPGLRPGSIEHSHDGSVFTLLLLLATVGTQVCFFVAERRPRLRMLAVLLSVLAVAIWAFTNRD